MLVGSALYDKHETGLACIAQVKACNMCMLHGCSVCFAQNSSTFVALNLSNTGNAAADLQKTALVG